jgi:archaellin
MTAALAFFDWLLPENQSAALVPPSIALVDNSTGGSTASSISTLQQEQSDVEYVRTGIDRTSAELFYLDLLTNSTSGGEEIAYYGCIAALGVRVADFGSGKFVDAKITVTIDPNTGSYGTGTLYKTRVYLAAANSLGAGSFPNNNAVFFPFSEDVEASAASGSIRTNGGRGGTGYNKVRIQIEPKTGSTGGATGVAVYNVHLSRIMLARCFYGTASNASLSYNVVDQSEIQRSFSGTPYVSSRDTQRRIGATFNDLEKHQIYGLVNGNITNLCFANINAINKYAGRSRNVIYSPRLKPPAGEYAEDALTPMMTVISEAWSNEHIYGLLEDPLNAQLVTVLPGSEQMWQSSFVVLETPLT